LLGQHSGFYGRALLLATSDGGRSWRRVRLPPGARPEDHSDVAAGVVALVVPPRLYVSLDEGRHWQRFHVDRFLFDCGSGRDGDEAWLSCGGPNGDAGAFILTTDDGGRTWTRRATPFSLERHVELVRHGEAWTISDAGSGGNYPHALWHTQDGGRTWHELWATVPPHAVVPVRSLPS